MVCSPAELSGERTMSQLAKNVVIHKMYAEILNEVKTEFLDLIKQHVPCQHQLGVEAYYAYRSCLGIRGPTGREDPLIYNILARNAIQKLEKPTYMAIESAFKKLKVSEASSKMETTREKTTAVETAKEAAMEQSLLLVNMQASWLYNDNETTEEFQSLQCINESEQTFWFCTDCSKAQEFIQKYREEYSSFDIMDRVNYTSYKALIYTQEVIKIHVDIILKMIHFYWSSRVSDARACEEEK